MNDLQNKLDGISMHAIRFYLNDQLITAKNIDPTTTLLRYVRDQLLLTGSKEGCAEGDCGACTMVVLDHSWDQQKVQYRAMNSCLILLPMVHEKYVYTVEALKQKQEYHPVQEAMVQRLGSQCGYCTPGIIMSLFEACYRDDIQEQWQIDDQMCGNLCRCTGYRPIQEAAQTVAGLRPNDRFLHQLEQRQSQGVPKHNDSNTLSFQHDNRSFFLPQSLEDLFNIWAQYPQAILVSGGTDLSLMITKRFEYPEVLIGLQEIPDLRSIDQDTVLQIHRIGAGVALSDVETMALSEIPSLGRMLRFFGARQIKNRGTLGGNLCTASPIGDTAPVLLALDAQLLLASAKGTRTVSIQDFFTGYRQTLLKEQELLVQVQIPMQSTSQPSTSIHTRAYKVSKRQELDISSVSAAFYIVLDDQQCVTTVRLAYGGMAATPARAYQAEKALLGMTWNETSVNQAMQALSQDFTPLNDHRSSAWYRQTVAKNLLYGFWLEISQQSGPALGNRPSATVQVL